MAKPWARWWLYLWGVVAVALLVLVFFLPFGWWAGAAAVGFGTLEGIGLWRADDAYPPLTHVIRRYVPRWAAFTGIYAFTGAAGGTWLGLSRPERLAALFGLLGWFTTHFDVTFDEDLEKVERAKNDRLFRRPLHRMASAMTRQAR
jgi:hypothetical protein